MASTLLFSLLAGLEVTFTYRNASVKSVGLGGYINNFTNQYRSTSNYAAQIDPRDWLPGDFPNNLYAFVLDPPANASDPQGLTQITDPDNPAFETIPGNQPVSVFQVPYDVRGGARARAAC
ncbi:hypothetical protein P8C59_009045 [Phyllachora maydis]|uniref:Uncharacterized protein n=1 Tax=Phyllachora maydis TaxID=1825666 RepID=A0AAD9ICQ5_9PEZI|nr:hypothetical protein P8C59_009045 [Phyllachora maydis]